VLLQKNRIDSFENRVEDNFKTINSRIVAKSDNMRVYLEDCLWDRLRKK
jgi:hypothetical protein